LTDADRDETVATRVFALPLVIVSGCTRAATLSGVLPDIAALNALFEECGVLGKTRNFGFSNALCALETLEAVTPAAVHAWTHAPGLEPRELPPAPIELKGTGEQVDLRFLVGAGVIVAAEPSFVETASNIGMWGMRVTHLLAAQLSQPGVEVLPLPRPPQDFLRAPAIGRSAHLEVTFDVFVSSALRRFRAAVGDPEVTVTTRAHEIEVLFSSPFHETFRETFRWRLHPLDDGGAIASSLVRTLEDYGLRNVLVKGEG
jgi:hypothetical protein